MREQYKLMIASGVVVSAMAVTPAKADSCSNLASGFHRAQTTITVAQTIPAGTFVAPDTSTITGLPKFCRVAGYTTPTGDSHIGFEVWIPEDNWNLKFLQVGCGGFCGVFFYSNMADPLRKGYAVAETDDGHQSANYTDGSWATGHPEKVIDWGYRGVKQTTDVAKDIIVAYKNGSARRSYFMGCSDGGREAQMTALRYPNDFDGIIVGSPANFQTHLFAGQLWNENTLLKTNLTESDVNIVSKAALAECVGKDGGLTSDQFLNNPLACHFDPHKLQCNGKNADACLSTDKVQAVEKIFSGSPGVFPGYRGNEGEANTLGNWPTWMLLGGAGPNNSLQGFFANNFFEYMVFPNSGWTPSTYSIRTNVEAADAKLASILNSNDPNLRPFKQHGGKMIQYAGWSDAAISPQNDVDYFHSITNELGEDATHDFYRMFMVPGMGHCQGGSGATVFGQVFGTVSPDPKNDIITVLDQWVDNGVAPDKIIATKYVNDDPTQGIAFQRPLCPFPQFAKYQGNGSTTSAASFACVKKGHDDNHGHDKEASNR